MITLISQLKHVSVNVDSFILRKTYAVHMKSCKVVPGQGSLASTYWIRDSWLTRDVRSLVLHGDFGCFHSSAGSSTTPSQRHMTSSYVISYITPIPNTVIKIAFNLLAIFSFLTMLAGNAANNTSMNTA